ncbi:hypothetical protein C367_00032 [Cryptococcus neoformans Ze90-1]|nr:hypothetical protein C367_00032 [Cryptococcus neoformans var. grubii Ze90-1]
MPSAWSDTLRREESGPQANLARSQETRVCLWKIENGVHRDRRRWLWLLETLDCFNQLEIDEIVLAYRHTRGEQSNHQNKDRGVNRLGPSSTSINEVSFGGGNLRSKALPVTTTGGDRGHLKKVE